MIVDSHMHVGMSAVTPCVDPSIQAVLAQMDHLGIDRFMVLGFCIGGPMIWNLLKRTDDRIVSAVLVHPSGYSSSAPDILLPKQHCRLGTRVL